MIIDATDEDLKRNGIYAIQCIPTNKVYIGQTYRTFRIRLNEHIGDLYKGKDNRYLQNAWEKYGSENFRFFIVEYAPSIYEEYIQNRKSETKEHISLFIDWLNYYESYYITYIRNSYGSKMVFNLNDGGDNSNPSEETRKLIGEASKKRKGLYHHSNEYKQRMSLYRKGKYTGKNACHNTSHSEETRLIISEKLKSYFAINNVWNKGKTLSKETCKKLSESHKGYVMPEEQRKKISESNKGKHSSKERNAKISEALKKFHENGGSISNITIAYSSYSRRLSKYKRLKVNDIDVLMKEYRKYLESKYKIILDDSKLLKIHQKYSNILKTK